MIVVRLPPNNNQPSTTRQRRVLPPTTINPQPTTQPSGSGRTAPRLLYAGIGVWDGPGGVGLNYKLLRNHPADRLCVVDFPPPQGLEDRRLPRVRYHDFPRPLPINSPRQQTLAGLSQALFPAWWSRQIEAAMDGYEPDAVFSVAHSWMWVPVLALARRRRIPFLLWVHDHWQDTLMAPRWLQGWKRRKFAAGYAAADVRFCISPNMRDEFRGMAGVEAELLYPSVLPEVVAGARPAAIRPDVKGLVFAYAGTIHTPGYLERLADLAHVLDAQGHRLLLHWPFDRAFWEERLGPAPKSLEFAGMLPPRDLVTELRHKADVLFAPMSFDPAAAPNMRVSFPSKLCEYALTGLPILVWGPEYSSAIRWARETPDAAIALTDLSREALADTVHALACDVGLRERLGKGAFACVNGMFSAEHAYRTFREALDRVL